LLSFFFSLVKIALLPRTCSPLTSKRYVCSASVLLEFAGVFHKRSQRSPNLHFVSLRWCAYGCTYSHVRCADGRSKCSQSTVDPFQRLKREYHTEGCIVPMALLPKAGLSIHCVSDAEVFSS